MDQATETITLCLNRVMHEYGGENWGRTWRGDVRKGRVDQPTSVVLSTAYVAKCLNDVVVKNLNIMRDIAATPETGK